MAQSIEQPEQLKPGDIYEDSYCHPCLCVEISGPEVKGISLVDGSYPRSEDVRHGKLRQLSAEEAWQWRLNGPQDKTLDLPGRWWQRDKPGYLINPGVALENLYFFALYQVQWDPRVQQALGSPVQHEWHRVTSTIVDNGFEVGRANITFEIKGKNGTAPVSVVAYKIENDWAIEYLSVKAGDKQMILLENGKSKE